MDLPKAPAPAAPGQAAEMRTEGAPVIRWEAADAPTANHAAIAASRCVLVRTIALLS
jgi:hypothetical protein